MVKAYLKYAFDGAFGVVASAACRSVESLAPDYVLTSSDHCVSLWQARLGEARLRFAHKLDEYNAQSQVTCFVLAHGGSDFPVRGESGGKPQGNTKFLFVGYKNGLIRRFPLDAELLARLPAIAKAETVHDDGVLYGHRGPVAVMALSTNNQLLLTGGDAQVLVWDAFNCQLVHRLVGHRGAILAVQYCATAGGSAGDADRLKLRRGRTDCIDALGFAVSASGDGTVKVWDILNEACVHTIVEPLLKPASLLLIHDIIYVSYANNNAINAYRIEDIYGGIKLLYTVSTGSGKTKMLAALPVGQSHSNDDADATVSEGPPCVLLAIQPHAISAFAILNDSERAARRAKRLKRINEKLRAKVAKLREAIRLTDRNITGKFSSVRAEYDYLRGMLSAGAAPAAPDNSAGGAPDGEAAGAAGAEAFIDTDFYRPLAVCGVGELIGDAVGEIVALRAHRRYAVLAMSNNNVVVLRVADDWSRRHSREIDIDNDIGAPKLFAPLYSVNHCYHTSFVRLAALSPSNKLLLTLSADALKLWSTHSNAVVHSVGDIGAAGADALRPSAVTHAAFVSDSLLLIVHGGPRIALYNSQSGACAPVAFDAPDDDVQAVHYNQAASELFMVFKRGSIYRMAIDIDAAAVTLIHSANVGSDVVFSRVGQCYLQPDNAFAFIYLSLANNNVVALRCDSLRVERTLYGHALSVVGLAVSDDAKLLATCSLDKTVKLWSVRFSNILKSVIVDSRAIAQLEFISNTHYLACVAHSGVVLLDCDSFATIAKLSTICPLRGAAVGKSSAFLYAVGASAFGVVKFAQSGELVFPDEQAEPEPGGEAAAHRLSKLDALMESLGHLADGGATEPSGLGKLINPRRHVFNVLLGVNQSALHGVLLGLPQSAVEQVGRDHQQLTDYVIATLEHCVAVAGADMRLANVELLVHVALATVRLFLRQCGGATAYRLRGLIAAVLGEYMDTVMFDKAGLEHVRNLINASNESLAKRIN